MPLHVSMMLLELVQRAPPPEGGTEQLLPAALGAMASAAKVARATAGLDFGGGEVGGQELGAARIVPVLLAAMRAGMCLVGEETPKQLADR